MHPSSEQAVERVIERMLANLADELTVDDMAQAAMFSKFHFTRVFQRVTGVSPGRFLSAIRLQEAKRLLTTTSFNVADISMLVGYNSVGTFSTRFTRSVGLSPTKYRRLGGFTPAVAAGTGSAGGNTIEGTVHVVDGTDSDGTVFMGLFPHRIPEGIPAACRVLDRPGDFRFTGVADGSWYLLCQAVVHDPLSLYQPRISVATTGPITVSGGRTIGVSSCLKPMSRLDPPVLLALLDSRQAALDRMAAYAA